MKILTVVGARPQFIKAATLSRALRREHEEVLVHTGQHYDHEMSGVFFDGLELPAPDVHLTVGCGPHGWQTARVLEGIERMVGEHRPRRLLIYGDTNSTLAGALAAAKLHVPVAHVEAGLRSFNRRMPEEINRLVADHVSDLLLCPSETAARNLAAEGIRRGVHVVGDVMQDMLDWARTRLGGKGSAALERYDVAPGRYVLVTVHRCETTDDPERLSAIVGALNRLQEPLLFPIHPRTRKRLAAGHHALGPHVRPIDPVGYLDMVLLAGSARMILTDSGGLQKEAYWLGVPCVTLREETKWVETVRAGWNTLVGTDEERILRAVRDFAPPARHPALYGNGDAAERCVELLET